MSETILRRDPLSGHVYDPRVPQCRVLVKAIWWALYGSAAGGEAMHMLGRAA